MLELHFFGSLALRQSGIGLDLRSRKALALLAADGPRPREALASLLSPRHDAAPGQARIWATGFVTHARG